MFNCLMSNAVVKKSKPLHRTCVYATDIVGCVLDLGGYDEKGNGEGIGYVDRAET